MIRTPSSSGDSSDCVHLVSISSGALTDHSGYCYRKMDP
jgi:hypothetical protein